jgi:thiaminase/transcriptional activator TenA
LSHIKIRIWYSIAVLIASRSLITGGPFLLPTESMLRAYGLCAVILVTRFSTMLRDEADPIWTQILAHPFVQELRTGTLPLDNFRYYLQQDYYYLMTFLRCLGLAVAKDPERIREFSQAIHNSITSEVDEVERLGKMLGVTPEAFRTVNPAPTTLAYTRHLFYIAYTGTMGELMAALLPCMWTYQDIGDLLGDAEAIRHHAIYSMWCTTYTSPAYQQLVSWYKHIVDQYAETAGPRVHEAMRRYFVLSSRYEYLFWEMAYRKEQWPL